MRRVEQSIRHNSELVLEIDDPDSMVGHSANAETKMFKLEKTLQLMFFRRGVSLVRRSGFLNPLRVHMLLTH